MYRSNPNLNRTTGPGMGASSGGGLAALRNLGNRNSSQLSNYSGPSSNDVQAPRATTPATRMAMPAPPVPVDKTNMPATPRGPQTWQERIAAGNPNNPPANGLEGIRNHFAQLPQAPSMQAPAPRYAQALQVQQGNVPRETFTPPTSGIDGIRQAFSNRMGQRW